MAGISVVKGMSLRIPAGAMTISMGEDGQPEFSVSRVEVSLDVWDHWLEIARERAIEAVTLHRRMLVAHQEGDGELVANLFGQMLRTSMTCMGALGFSLDALYSSIKERMPEQVLSTVGSKKTARHQFVSETLKRSARLTNEDAKLVRSIIKQVFQFRDAAVHPEGGWAEPVRHPELGVDMASAFVSFSANNAARGYVSTLRVVELILVNARPKYRDLAEWASGAVQRIPEQLPAEIATVRWTDQTQGDESDAGPAAP